MATGRQHENWTQTANLLAMIANTNRGEDSEAYTWQQFHPHYDVEEPEAPEATPELLMAMGFRPVEKSNG